jgi:hypothetical protein
VRAGGPESGSFDGGFGEPKVRNEAAMAGEDRAIPLSNVITIDDERISHLAAVTASAQSRSAQVMARFFVTTGVSRRRADRLRLWPLSVRGVGGCGGKIPLAVKP